MDGSGRSGKLMHRSLQLEGCKFVSWCVGVRGLLSRAAPSPPMDGMGNHQCCVCSQGKWKQSQDKDKAEKPLKARLVTVQANTKQQPHKSHLFYISELNETEIVWQFSRMKAEMAAFS